MKNGANTTVSFGGGFTSNFVSVGAEYQTIYVPFATNEPFRQALMLTFRLQGIGNFQGSVGSYVGPDGTVLLRAGALADGIVPEVERRLGVRRRG